MADEKKESPAVTPAVPDATLMQTAEQVEQKSKKLGLKREFSSRERLIIRMTLLVIAVLAVDFMILHPISGYLDRLDEKIKFQELLIPKRLMILKHKKKIMNEYISLERFVTDPEVTQEEETAKFLREIERVSKNAGIFVSNINPVKIIKDSDEIYRLGVDFDGKGGLKEIRNFMSMIESENPAMRVDGFLIKPQGKDSDELKYQFSISKIALKKDGVVANAPVEL